MKKLSPKQEKRMQEKKKLTSILQSIFMDIWHDRRHYSEISGRWLGKEPLSTFFHHILPKSSYPNAMFDTENIILLTTNEHGQVEITPQCFEEINKRREKLKLKYDRSSKEKLLE